MGRLSQVLLQFILVAIICWAIPKTGLAYSLSVNPSTIEAGATVTVSWSTPPEDNLIRDWIGLYEVGSDDRQYISWQLTGGVPRGNLPFTIHSQGTYEFRYFKHYGYIRMAISDQVIVVSSVDGNYTLTVDKGQVIEGQQITVSWAAPQGADLRQDWIGLYEAGSANTRYLSYWYTGDESASSIQVTMSNVGVYVFRYLKNNGYTSVAETEEITVIADPAYTISVDKTTVTPGDTVAVSWTAPENANLSLDWIGLYTVGSGDRQYISWDYTNDASSGNLSFVIEDVGTYEFRYFKNNGYKLVMVSPQVVVGTEVVALSLKLPLPEERHWYLTVEAGGETDCTNSGYDDFHSEDNAYFSLDFAARNFETDEGKEQIANVPILAAGSGKVIEAPETEHQFNGHYVRIDHDEPYDGSGYTSYYLHLQDSAYDLLNKFVSQGKQIGLMGNTGESFGIHLHFQMKYDNRRDFSTDELRLVRVEGRAIESYSVGCRIDNPPTGFYLSTNKQFAE